MIDLKIILSLIGIYFAVILGLVVHARLKETKQLLPGLNEFFLAGKNLHPVILTFTYVGSLFSTFSILGMPGLAYAHGPMAPGFVWIATALGCLSLAYIGKRFRRYAENKRIFSPIEIISERYKSRKLGLYMAVIFTIFLMPYISLQLVGIGKFLESYTGGDIGYTVGVGSMMIIVIMYLFLGGMRAVAYTDFIQLIAIFLGLICGLTYFLHQNDLSIPDVFREIKDVSPAHMSFEGPKGYYTLAMVVTSGIALLGIFFQPHLLTRTIMASRDRDIDYIILGTMIGVCITTSLAFIFGLTGVLTYGTDLAPNTMMGSIFLDMGAAGMVGLFLSGLMLMGALGAAMSTADSLLISIGQISTRDTIRPFIKLTPQKQILISKGIMLLILILAFVTGLNPPQFMTDLAMYSSAGCTVLIPTILSFQWKKRSKLAAYISITLGLIALLIAVMLKFSSGQDPLGLHVGIYPFTLSFISYYAICLAMKNKKPKTNTTKTAQTNNA